MAEKIASTEKPVHKPETDICKTLICLATAIFTASFVLCAVSWLMTGDMPHELLTGIAWPYFAGLGAYCCKSAYKYRCKP